MNIKAYFLASLVAPFIALIYMIVGLSIDTYTGHFDVSQEISDGGVFFLALSYLLFTLVCLIATFVIVFFAPLLLKSMRVYNRRNFLLMGALTGAIVAVISLSLMADGNLTRDNGLYTLWFTLAGMIFGLVNVYIYSKFAYALDLCD